MAVLKKLKEKLPEYIKEVKSRNQENAIAFTFSTFIHDVFGVKSMDMDFEKPVKSEVLQVRGRIDAILGNIIIEFKKDLKTGLDTAKEELQKYFQMYLERSESNFIGIANDGINFKVYYPIEKDGKITGIEEIDSLNLEKRTISEIFLWFDSYFFSEDSIAPTSDDIKRRFGLDSPTYILMQKKLEILFEKVESFKPAMLKYDNWNRYLETVYGNRLNDKSLFFKHTYLSTLVKMIIHVKISGNRPNMQDEIIPILYGGIFEQSGIKNFMEEDFYTWVLSLPIRKQASKIFYKLLQEVYIYDLNKINEDVLKELYQELVDPDVRKLLGEFYTPDWLAESMIKDVFQEDPTKSVMDPSCGSGTFIFKIIQYKIKELTKMKWKQKDILAHIIENVIGFDIHPLAVIISKTNYLLALKEVLHARAGSISIPIYLSDTLKIPAKNNNVSLGIQTFTFNALDKKFNFPVSVARDMTKMDDVIDMLKEYGRELESNIEKSLERNYNFDVDVYIKNTVISFNRFLASRYDDNESSVLRECLRTLYDLIINNMDAIWPYILRNMYKPVSISIKKVDVIIGNPPWLTMQGMKNKEYQDYLKNNTIRLKLINTNETHQFPHIELATLFCSMTMESYLNKFGKLAFVMPKSVLIASHHSNFREFTNPKVKLEQIYDVEKVKPLFKIPTCVIFCKNNDVTKYPVKEIKIVGDLPEKNVNIETAKKHLTFTTGEYKPVQIELKQSRYYNKFYQGATIVPRNFYFVTPKITSTLLGINLEAPIVTSDERNDTKPPWTMVITKEIESNFIYGSVLGSDLIPFGVLRYRPIAMPIEIKNGIPKLYTNYKELQIAGFTKAAKYFENIEELWAKHSTTKQKTMPIYKRLDYRRGMSKQNLKRKYKVLYVASSTYLTSCIIDQTKKLYYKTKSIKLNLKGFIAESKTYYFETDDYDEAHFLCAILNSKIIDELIKPLQTQGLWGPRDIHKRPLLIPIPIYDSSNSIHKKLSELSETCHIKSSKYKNEIIINKIGTVRRDIRIMLSDELNVINNLTKKALIEEDPSIKKLFES